MVCLCVRVRACVRVCLCADRDVLVPHITDTCLQSVQPPNQDPFRPMCHSCQNVHLQRPCLWKSVTVQHPVATVDASQEQAVTIHRQHMQAMAANKLRPRLDATVHNGTKSEVGEVVPTTGLLVIEGGSWEWCWTAELKEELGAHGVHICGPYATLEAALAGVQDTRCVCCRTAVSGDCQFARCVLPRNVPACGRKAGSGNKP